MVLDEIEATKAGVERANPGDLVVVCVDRARAVWDELQVIGQRRRPARRTTSTTAEAISIGIGDPPTPSHRVVADVTLIAASAVDGIRTPGRQRVRW